MASDDDARESTRRGSERRDSRRGGAGRTPTGDGDPSSEGSVQPTGAPDVVDLRADLDGLREEVDAFAADVESRTVDRAGLEADLKAYVRSRQRRGHARGWGPYLVLLYGTVLTLGAFYFLDGGYAIAAMLILGLSTLGLYVLFVLFGLGLHLLAIPALAIERSLRRLRR